MTQAYNIDWSDEGTLEVLTFEVGGETFAIEAVWVREVLDPLPVTRVPGADPLAGAIINFRGRVIPLADLAVAFGMERAAATADARIVVLELRLAGEAMLIGFATDRVHEVTTLALTDAESPPQLGLRWPRDLVRCLVRRGGDVVVMPDLPAVFAPLVGADADAPLQA